MNCVKKLIKLNPDICSPGPDRSWDIAVTAFALQFVSTSFRVSVTKGVSPLLYYIIRSFSFQNVIIWACSERKKLRLILHFMCKFKELRWVIETLLLGINKQVSFTNWIMKKFFSIVNRISNKTWVCEHLRPTGLVYDHGKSLWFKSLHR